MTEVVVISVQGREYLTGECIKSLATRGGLNATNVRRRVFWSGTGDPPDFEKYGWEVVVCPIERPASLSVLRVFKAIGPRSDLLFFEDDIIPCRNAVIAAINVKVPETAGMISFFDYRCEWKSPGIFKAPSKRPLWGSQAVKFPAKVVQRLLPYLAEKCRTDLREGKLSPRAVAWDTWMGYSVENDLGLDLLHYSPTLFQHGGAKYSIANEGTKHPYARNFPGEDWDALTECPDPVPNGRFTEYFKVCKYHGVQHADGLTCRYWPIRQVNERKEGEVRT